ncbi:hypothetical protein O3Q51_14550 [Cryomorphaceae bacterium 1068]|nr:hypothetical protein [Cryomorphaceae bacterium 1068]
MKEPLFFILCIAFCLRLEAQVANEIREDHELGKAYVFEAVADSIKYELEFIQTSFIGSDGIKATFVFTSLSSKTGKTKTIGGDLACFRVPDILLTAEDGHTYNPKTCTYYKDNLEYIVELDESETGYPAARLTIAEPSNSQTLKTIEFWIK